MGVMAYLAQIHRPSSVRHALKLNLLSSDEECLVVAKANRLEIYAQNADGLTLKYARAIYGKVTMLQKLHPANSTTDHLFIGTNRYTYFTVSWNNSEKQLTTERAYTDLADKVGRDAQTLDRCHIDPTRRFMTLELFEGILTVIPISQKYKKKGDIPIESLGEPIPVRISELLVRSSAFVYPRSRNPEKEKAKLAILYEDSHEKVRLKFRSLEFDGTSEPESAAFEIEDDAKNEMDLGASHIIPVPGPAYGLLILAETSITYIDETSKQMLVEPLQEATIFATWEQVDAQRWLLADDYGRLYFLMLILEGDEVSGWKLDLLGETSRASVLVYLDSGYVFVGSHQGDSQVIKILEQSIEMIQIIANIAPILDFTIMDMGSRAGEGQTNEYSSGKARIVTGSGAFKDGSLRSVRSGVGLEELGTLGDMEHITDLFSIQCGGDPSKSNILIVSFIDETRIFKFNADGEVEEIERLGGLETSESTLLTKNVSQSRLLQVTAKSARVSELVSGIIVAEWTPSTGNTIVAASADSRHLALSISGLEVVVLDFEQDLRVTSRREFGEKAQISCISVPEVVSGVCIIGFWQRANIAIVRIDTLESIRPLSNTSEFDAVPRSVVLTQILPEQSPTLFIALADGHVVTYAFDTTKYTLSDKKTIVLGTQQAKFQELRREDGRSNVFAMCEHPSLIYGSEGRIVYSAVTAEKATCICPFDSEAYPGAIAIATPEDLKIALVDNERTTHVQTLLVRETVRRLAYSTNEKAFGIGTIKRTLENGIEVVQSHFKLVDEVVFKELDTFDLNEEELIESVVRIDLSEEGQETNERFVVGTAYLADRTESERGRIIVFEVTQDRTLKVVTSLSVKGACRALEALDGRLVAALVKTVVVYKFEFGTLNKTASYRTATAPIDITVTGNLIGIADIMKSISIVRYQRGTAGTPDTLLEVARNFQIGWTTAVASIDENTFLESDAEGNLTVLHQNINGVTPDDRRRLEVTSEIQLGEMVNKMQRIDIPTSADATVIPRAFIATVEGSIYLFALIAHNKKDLLMRLQANLANFVQSPGNMPFMKYRAFKNNVREADEPYRFVDGELVERFLDCSSQMQEEIVEGLGVEAAEVRGMVEGLRRLH